MPSSIKHNAGHVQATKSGTARRVRRKSLIDDHAARDGDDRNFWAHQWSLGVTFKVLVAQEHTSASPEHVRELHTRLFPGGWPALRNLRDGWVARAFHPLSYADLNPTGIPDHDELCNRRITMTAQPAGGLPTTLQLGIFLGWAWPIYKPNDGSCDDSAASATLAEGFRRRCESSKGNPAQTWHNRRMRIARAVRELESRISAEGVSVEWGMEPNMEPCFRSVAGGPAVTVAHVLFGSPPADG
jgi:hypothetical protein